MYHKGSYLGVCVMSRSSSFNTAAILGKGARVFQQLRVLVMLGIFPLFHCYKVPQLNTHAARVVLIPLIKYKRDLILKIYEDKCNNAIYARNVPFVLMHWHVLSIVPYAMSCV
jgi:hypothetical protein